MISLRFPLYTGAVLTLVCLSGSPQPPAPRIEKIAVAPEPRLTISSTVGSTNLIEYASELATNQWLVLTNLVVTTNPYVVMDLSTPVSPKRFYRVAIGNAPQDTNTPTGMVLIPAGSFTMGNCLDSSEGNLDELPLHTVYVSAFYMDQHEVTKALWDEVYAWAVAHGYSFDNAGSGKAANHPVQTVNWHDVVKWCNARSQKEGKIPAYYTSAAQTTVYLTGRVEVQNSWVKWNAGYRLPTEAEWEKAARGGESGHRFPWSDGDTITHNQANYYSDVSYGYDQSTTRDYHPNYESGGFPYTSPVGSFPLVANGYSVQDIAGNVWEWCWDWYGAYSSGTQNDPRGPASGSSRVNRGGSWYNFAYNCRVAYRGYDWPGLERNSFVGFRSVLPPGQ